jgi:hypothetical protein
LPPTAPSAVPYVTLDLPATPAVAGAALRPAKVEPPRPVTRNADR